MITVLYVDDEPALLELTRLFLERYGNYSVDTVTSASDALDRMKTTSYDAIVSDYQMPVMDGIELLKCLRKEGVTIPFILFTGRGREEIAIEALNAGVDFYLQKGGDPRSQFAELEHKLRLAIERRRIAGELCESRQRMTDIVSHLPDATFAVDLKGNVIVWNRAMEEMTGVKEEEILGAGGHVCAAAIYGDGKPVLLDLVLERKEDVEEYYPGLTVKDDRLIAENYIPYLYGGKGAHVWLIASPLYDAHGNITGAIESIRDITDRKLAQDALYRSEEKFRALTEQANDVIYLMDTDGRIIHINPRVARYGYTPEELI
ncbi:MAG: PAS domain S-box protein, partial [Methanoculleus sp.]